MKKALNITLCIVLLSAVVALIGCGKKADENKPVSEVKAEAEKLDLDQLKAMAATYKQAMADKTAEISKVAEQLKEISITKMVGEEAKAIRAEMSDLSKSLNALKERFDVYYSKLKEKGGDL